MADERGKAIELAVSQIEKQFGKGSIMRLGSKEAIVPISVISTGALIYVTIKSFQPFPSFPYNYAPLIDAIWFVIGLGILGVLWYRKKDDWIARAGEATVDADEIKETDPA